MTRLAALTLGAALLAAAPAAAAPVRVSPGALTGLSVHRGQAYGVVDVGAGSRPLALVRSTGRSAGRRTAFGAAGAQRPDVAAGSGGVAVAWSRLASGGELWYAASGSRLRDEELIGHATGPARIALSGGTTLLAGPDVFGNAIIARPIAGGETARTVLTTTGPHERHFPLDMAMLGSTPLVLDLGQVRTRSVVRVLGTGAPSAPVVSAGGVQDIRGTIAVSGRTIRVAFMRGGRAYLASATASTGSRWRVRRLRGPGGGTGAPSVTPGGEVAFIQRGAGRRDVYLWNGRLRRLTRTATGEQEAHLAADGRTLIAGWTRTTPGGSRPEAMLERIR